MENAPIYSGIQSMTYMTTAEYRELVEDRILYKLATERLERKKSSLIDEVDGLRELLEQTKKELEETKAENKELVNGLSHWYAAYKRLEDEKTDADDQKETDAESEVPFI